MFSMIFRVDPDCFLSKIWIPSYGNDLDSIRTFSPCQPVLASNSSSSSWCSASFQVKVSEKHQHLKITCNIKYIKNILRSSSEKNGGEPPGTNIDFWELSVRLCVPLAVTCGCLTQLSSAFIFAGIFKCLVSVAMDANMSKFHLWKNQHKGEKIRVHIIFATLLLLLNPVSSSCILWMHVTGSFVAFVGGPVQAYFFFLSSGKRHT